MKEPLQILNKFWGFSSFKPLQEDIIRSVIDGKDTVALLPTGGGKSVCFQIPALAMEGICIVVSPLVALMTDQVQQLKAKGIKALSITGGIPFDELRNLLDNSIYGNYKFLYLSPERLQQEMVQNAIREMNVNSIAVDEAHCISQWGNDFRPAYKNITALRTIHPLAPIIALTATATPEVLEDTIVSLELEMPSIFKKSFARKNLAYKVYEENDKLYRIEQLLKKHQESSIIYVRSRKMAIEYSKHLNAIGVTSTFYHGGISKRDKTKRLEQWRNGQVSTMVATNAFGMGIDHATVRTVIHVQLPESIESYFQEAGRAGRDGKYAEAVLLHSEYDKHLVKKQFVDSLPSTKDLKFLYKKLNNYFQVSYGEGEFSEFNFSFAAFCNVYQLNAILTYNGLQSLDRLGVIKLSQEFGRKSSMQFLISSEKVLDYFKSDVSVSVIGKTLLRLYGGIFETETFINLDLVSKKTGQPISTVISVLEKMKTDTVINLNLRTTDAAITFLKPREDDKTINVIAKEVETLNNKKRLQVASVLQYIENEKVCKSLQLLQYFGEDTSESCGICSVCAAQQAVTTKSEVKLISEKILALLEEQPYTSRALSENIPFAETKILQVLRLLVDANTITLNTKNEYCLA